MRMMRTLVPVLFLASLTSLAGVARAEEEAAPPQPHEDAVVKAATERFEKDFADPDMDKRLRILRWYGMHMHKTVLRDLKGLWLREKNVELQAAAAEGLGNQRPYARPAAEALMEGLAKYEEYATRDIPEGDAEELQQTLESRVLVCALEGLGKLKEKPDKKGWKLIRGLIDHRHDDVVIAMLGWCGATKEWRSLPIILEWFEFYPDGYSWAGGSTSVDTGAAGNKDQQAAQAKYKAKYGGRAKKARPKAHDAMKKALKDITGHDFEAPKDLKAWMEENAQLLKKNGV